jgi:hypothetical protein
MNRELCVYVCVCVYIYISRIRKIVLGNLAIIMAMKIVTVVSLDSVLFFCDLI